MLLGSPPDLVHGDPLRETGPAVPCGGLDSFLIVLYRSEIINKNFWRSEKNSLYNRENYGIIACAAARGARGRRWKMFLCSAPANEKSGLVAQLGERCVRIAEVEGSIPFESTKNGNRRGKNHGDFSFDHRNTTDRFWF